MTRFARALKIEKRKKFREEIAMSTPISLDAIIQETYSKIPPGESYKGYTICTIIDSQSKAGWHYVAVDSKHRYSLMLAWDGGRDVFSAKVKVLALSGKLFNLKSENLFQIETTNPDGTLVFRV